MNSHLSTFSLQAKLDEMEKSVANPDLGSDLRGVKDLLKKHQNLETELVVLSDQIASIISQGQALAQSGHFDKANILKAVEDFNKRWEKEGSGNTLRRLYGEEKSNFQTISKQLTVSIDLLDMSFV